MAHQIKTKRSALFSECRDHRVLAHGQSVEQLIDLIALRQTELAHASDAEAGDVAAFEHDAPFGR
jgi:hypothetical protein